MIKGTLSPQYALRPEFVVALKLQARRLGNIEKARSRRQWVTAQLLLTEWQDGGYADELTKDEFYVEASRCICDELGFAFVSLSGETVKVWCEVFAQFEYAPPSLKEQLPFQYFRNARWLANHNYVALPLAAISTALDHKLTADEMKRWYTGDKIPDAHVLEFRNNYPQPFWGLFGWVVSANGNKDKILWHMGEIQRLHEADEQSSPIERGTL